MAKKKKELKPEHKVFIQHYVIDWNATKAYQKIYPDCKDESARKAASLLLTNIDIQEYVKEVQANIEKQCNISQAMVLNEYKKLAFNSIAGMHNTWITRKELDELSDELKACISEIHTRTRRILVNDEPAEIEEIRIKLYDKKGALDSICKMLGYNEPERLDLGEKTFKVIFDKDVKKWLG